jgi:predicted RNA-binding Zn-ribbon protein involved in translation (DUF1610 family)
MLCPSCEGEVYGGRCIRCGAKQRGKEWGWGMGDKKKLPTWKAGEVVYCDPCGLVIHKDKAKTDRGIFEDEGTAFRCPKCGADLEEIKPEAKA